MSKKGAKNYRICHQYGKLTWKPIRGRLTKFKSSRENFAEKKTERISDGGIETPIKISGSQRILFQRESSKKPSSSYATVYFRMEKFDEGKTVKKVTFGEKVEDSKWSGNGSKKEMIITLPVKGSKMVSKGVQTDYRESETQTFSWRHEIRVGRSFLNQLLAVEPFFLGIDWNFVPGLEEVTLIERAREKLAWENVVGRLRGRENDSRRKVLVARIAEAETAIREKTTAKINEERMNMSKKLIMRERERRKDELGTRLFKLYGTKRTENDKKIRRWNHQLSRKIRKIKTRQTHSVTFSDSYSNRTTKKEKTFPRGHRLVDFQFEYLKKYEGLNLLEKHILNQSQRKSNGFDYEEASKPKKFDSCSKRLRHEGWKKITTENEDGKNKPFLMVPVQAPTPGPPTPETDRPETELEEELNQASILLVKIVKGRAVQTKKFLQYSKLAGDMHSDLNRQQILP